jgi:23S rRNA pseudouridine955/2504/2580 synthase
MKGRGQGPRQPGGGKQTAGPRHCGRNGAKRHRATDEGREGRRGKPSDLHPRRGDKSHSDAKRFEKRERPARAQAAPPPSPSRHRAEKPAPAFASTGVQNVVVLPDEDGMRVDRFLEARFPGLSFSHIQRVIRKGEVRVSGKRVDPKDRLKAGVGVRIPPFKHEAPKPREGAPEDVKTRDFLKSITLYEDDDVMVLNKPQGLAVQGGSGTTRHIDGMLEVMRGRDGQRPRLVHRLDKDTAGCLLVAKTRFAASALAKNFRSRSARKIYWALAAGVPKPKQGRISTFLAREQREEDSFMRVAAHGEEGASHAVTYYAVVETAAQRLAWLSLKPVTGRTHQLRAHLDHIGHPIVGDPKYFAIENWELPGGIQNRLHLLARRIAIPHPRGGTIDVTAPLPPHMTQSWNLLGFDISRYDPIEQAPEEE